MEKEDEKNYYYSYALWVIFPLKSLYRKWTCLLAINGLDCWKKTKTKNQYAETFHFSDVDGYDNRTSKEIQCEMKMMQ